MFRIQDTKLICKNLNDQQKQNQTIESYLNHHHWRPTSTESQDLLSFQEQLIHETQKLRLNRFLAQLQ